MRKHLCWRHAATMPLFCLILALPSAITMASPANLHGNSGWTAVMYGEARDYPGDSQAGAADTDLVGDALHGSFYVGYDDRNSPTEADDRLLFRARIGNPTAPGEFSGVATVGMDANLDGRIDLFMSLDARRSIRAFRFLEPGTGLNSSPSTTTTAPLPSGWLPNNGIYPSASNNFSAVEVTVLTDPHWNGDADVGDDSKADLFVSWSVPLADLATVLAKPSPVNRSGVYGPRGPGGIQGFNRNTLVKYIIFTQTQPGPINGDLNGVGGSYDRNATYSTLGALTSPMTAATPVADGPSLTIDNPAGYATINRLEGTAATVSGTSFYLSGKPLQVTVTDGVTVIDGSTTVLTNGSWSCSKLDLRALQDGVLTITATVDLDANPAPLSKLQTTAFVVYDRTPPVVTVSALPETTAGYPLLTGTSDLPNGSIIMIDIDPDNNPATADLTYEVAVSSNLWRLDTSLVLPATGTVPLRGLTSHARIVAHATDSAGNTASVTALNRPSVNAVATNRTRPVLSGSWTKLPGDNLSVTVLNATYELDPADNLWSLDLETTVPSSGSLPALVPATSYDVIATVSRGTESIADITTNELTITTTPIKRVTINGAPFASGTDPTPVLSGDSENAGAYVVVRLDPGNDGNLGDAVTYSAVIDDFGKWTLNTETAPPISGFPPTAGYTGEIGVVVTDSTGSVSADLVLTVATPSVWIGNIFSTALSNSLASVNNSNTNAQWLNGTEDDAVTITGMATPGFRVNVTVADDNGLFITTNNLPVAADGSWFATNLNLSGLDNSFLQVIAELAGTKVSTTNQSVFHDKTAPRLFITIPSTIPKSSADLSGASELPNTLLRIMIFPTNSSVAVFSNVVTTTGTGAWSLNTGSGNSLASGNDGGVNIQVSTLNPTFDSAGNIVQTETRFNQYVKNGAANTTQKITIGTIAGNNTITHDEIAGGIQITGVTSLTSAATNLFKITVTDGNTTAIAAVTSNAAGTWSALLLKSQLLTLKTGPLTVWGSVTDSGSGITVYDVRLATLDLPNPVPTITDNVPGIATNIITYTFRFSEPVSGFEANDLLLNLGSIKSFSGNGSTYTAEISPPTNSNGRLMLSIATGAALSVYTARPSAGASSIQDFNTSSAAAAPSLTVNTSSLATNSTPLLFGTAGLQPGASVVILIDVDNDGTPDVSYSAPVKPGGIWELDISSAVPTKGILPPVGLPPYAKVTIEAVNAYGIGNSIIALNSPAVHPITTNARNPVVSGTWSRVPGDTLTISLQGLSYSSLSNVLTTATNWCFTHLGTLSDGYHDVTATVSRSAAGSTTDITLNEILIDTLASLTISGGSLSNTVGSPYPTISGTSMGFPEGALVRMTLDLDLDGLADVSFRSPISSDFGWSLNTASALPVSGKLPPNGLNGPVCISVSATDPAGNIAADTQVLVVDVTPPALALTFNSRTADSQPLITGISDLAPGSLITVQIDPNDDGDFSDGQSYEAVVMTGGFWSVQTTFPLSGTARVQAAASDDFGNTSLVSRTLTLESMPPMILITFPLEGNGDNTLDSSEDNSLVVSGTSKNVPPGSLISVAVTDGSITIFDNVPADVDGGWALAALNVSSMANGPITITASCLDDVGNVFTATASLNHNKSGAVTIDSISTDTGLIADFVTSDTSLSFHGSASAEDLVAVTLSGSSGVLVTSNVQASVSGAWSLDLTSLDLPDGVYTLSVDGGMLASQLIVIDTVPPAGPVSVHAQPTAGNISVITGSALLNFGERLSVNLNGKSYTVGDGSLSLTGDQWQLVIPPSDALAPAFGPHGFSGHYEVVATIQDLAGNQISGNGSLTLRLKAPQEPLEPSFAALQSFNTTNLLTVSGGSGTGAVSYVILSGPGVLIDGNQLWVTNGTGTVEIAALKDADDIYLSSSITSSVTALRIPATLDLTSSSATAASRSEITITATIPEGTGTIQFVTNGVHSGGPLELLGTPVTLRTSALPRGTNVISAIYSGDSNLLPATNTLLQIITNQPPVSSTVYFARNGFARWKISTSDLLKNIIDPDGDSLVLSGAGISTNGVSLSLLSGYLLYYNPNLVDDLFTCQVSDGFGGTNQLEILLLAQSSAALVGQNHSIQILGSSVIVHFAGIAGYRYNVQRSTDFASWETVAVTNAPAEGIFQFLDDSPPEPSAFYRLMWNGN